MDETYDSFAADIARNLASRQYRAGQRRRIDAERALFAFGEECGWDRDRMVDYCVRPESPSAWLGRAVFEASFDDGSMRRLAAWFDRAGRAAGYTS